MRVFSSSDSIKEPRLENDSRHILIIGGGVAGLSAALQLTNFDYSITLIEQSGALGGHAARFSCKATHQCVKCGACLLEQKLNQITQHPNIEIILETSIQNIGKDRRFFIDIQTFETTERNGKKLHNNRLEADAIIVATGFKPFNPELKPYGYNRFEDVITNLELENMLRAEGAVKRPSNDALPENIAFIQCVGSRDAKLNHLWCSKICCGSALRMANRIKWQQPDTQITVFYIDIQTFGKDFEVFFSRIREDIRLIRTIPGDIIETENSRLQVSYFEAESKEEIFDLVVLSVGMMPQKANFDLFKQLYLSAGGDSGPMQYETFTFPFREGVFPAGSVLAPMNIADSIASAQKAAQNVVEYFIF